MQQLVKNWGIELVFDHDDRLRHVWHNFDEEKGNQKVSSDYDVAIEVPKEGENHGIIFTYNPKLRNAEVLFTPKAGIEHKRLPFKEVSGIRIRNSNIESKNVAIMSNESTNEETYQFNIKVRYPNKSFQYIEDPKMIVHNEDEPTPIEHLESNQNEVGCVANRS